MSRKRHHFAILGLAAALAATGAIAAPPTTAEALGMAAWSCTVDLAYAGRSWSSGGQTTTDHGNCGKLSVRLSYTRGGQPGYNTEWKLGTTKFVGISMAETTGACHKFNDGGWIYPKVNCT